MGGFARFLADHLMLASIYDRWIRFPKVAKRSAFSVIFRDQIPKSPTSFFWPVPDVKRNDLPRPSAKCYPNPSFLYFFTHKWPQLVQFEYIIFFGWNQRAYDSREELCFFYLTEGCLVADAEHSAQTTGRSAFLGRLHNHFFERLTFLRTLWKTPPKPHALHLYLGFPELFEPFFTICSEPHLWQHFFQLPWPVFFWTKLSKTPTKLHYHGLPCAYWYS